MNWNYAWGIKIRGYGTKLVSMTEFNMLYYIYMTEVDPGGRIQEKF